MGNLIINTNINALNANRNLRMVSNIQENASRRLTSGLRVMTAADDAAGLAISEGKRSQIMGVEQASRNSQDAISLINVADAGLQSISDKLHRIKELMVYAANDTHSPSDRELIQNEVDQLLEEIDRMTAATQFNGRMLLSGDYASVEGFLGAIGELAGVEGFLSTTSELANEISAASNALMGARLAVPIANSDVQAAEESVSTSRANLLHVLGHIRANAALSTLSGAGGAVQDAALQLDALLSAASSAVATINNAAGLAATGGRAPEELWQDIEAALNAANNATFQNPDPSIRDAFTTLREALANPEIDFASQNFVNDMITLDATVSQMRQTAELVVQGEARMRTTLEQYQRPSFPQASEGSWHGPLHLQVGANSNNSAFLSIGRSDTVGLGIDVLHRNGPYGGGATGAAEDISGRLDHLEGAITKVAIDRALLGAMANRLGHTISYLDSSSENVSAARSRITDADMAHEMMNLSRGNILQQAATAMLAQANQGPNNVMQLLQQ